MTVSNFGSVTGKSVFDGASYVADMTHHAQIDINGITTVEWDGPVSDQTVLLDSTDIDASETIEVEVNIAEPFGRTIRFSANDAGVGTIYGYDFLGQEMSEKFTVATANTDIEGKKAFKRVVRVTAASTLDGKIKLEAGQELGLPFMAVEPIRETSNGVAASEGAITAPDLSTPTDSTGDVRGTYDPGTTTNGSRNIRLTYLTTNQRTGGLYGPRQK